MKRFPSEELTAYIESDIIPRYETFDAAHRADHALTVIDQSLTLAQHYDIDINMVYAIAAFHDTGLVRGREKHHIYSGEILRADKMMQRLFTPQQLSIMSEAIEDHRASSDHAPRSIYGRIVAEADRCIDASTIIRRTIQYGLAHTPELDIEGQYERCREHITRKYGDGGYLKLWIAESDNADRLKEFQEIIRDPQRLRGIFDTIYDELA